MLHWLYIFSFFILCLVVSLAFLNKNLMGMLMVAESILIILFGLGLAIGGRFNIYYITILAFFIIVLGGLELALNLILVLL